MEQDRSDRRKVLLPLPQLRYSSPTRRNANAAAGMVVPSGSPERRRLIREMEKSRESERVAYKRSSSSQESQDSKLNRSPGDGTDSPIKRAQKRVQFVGPLDQKDNSELASFMKSIDERLTAIENRQKELSEKVESKLLEILKKLESLLK